MTASRSTTAPVVLATDGTSASDGALRYAVEQARTRGAELRILHVMPMAVPVPPLRPVEPVDLEPYARKVLARSTKHARDLAPGLAVSTMLAHGGRVRGIVDGSADAQLVVVGRETSHGLGATPHRRHDGRASRRTRTCPVVVVPGDWRPRSDAEAARHGRGRHPRPDDASHLMAAAYAQATSLGASITVVHAWELPDPYIDRVEARTHSDEWQALGEQLLAEALGTWRDQHPHLSVETRVVHGHAASVLVAEAKAADLFVVRRAHEHRPLDHLGATVRALLLASPAPVEVVPGDAGVSHMIGRAGRSHPGLPARRPRDRAPGHQGAPRERGRHRGRRGVRARPGGGPPDPGAATRRRDPRRRLPDGSGIDVCREIRSVDPTIAALILTSYDDDDALFAAIMAGAAGYILKQVRGNDLVETVRRVAAGQSTLDPSVTAQVLDRLRNGPPKDPELEALTAQEQRILELIGEGLTNRQIAERMYLAEKTVKNYVSSMLAKLRADQPDPGGDLRDQASTHLSRCRCAVHSSPRPLTPGERDESLCRFPDAVPQAGREGGIIMYAHKGDRIVVRNQHVDGPVRDGEIVAVEHQDGSPPYRVRWSDNGHESLFFPGPDSYIDHGDVPAPSAPDNG